MDRLLALQNWYVSRCDGDWEHQYGIEITTLDNPGWRIEIDIRADPRLGNIGDEEFQNPDDEDDWLSIHRRDGKIHLVCGPRRLTSAIDAFLAALEGDGRPVVG